MQHSHDILVCRPGMESDLVDEMADRAAVRAESVAPGLVHTTEDARLPVTRFCFERQRMPGAGFIPGEILNPPDEATVRSVLGFLCGMPRPWTLHVFGVEEGLGRSVAATAEALERRTVEIYPDLAAHFMDPADPATARPETVIVQGCLTSKGLYHSVARMDRLSDRFSGGVVRMPDRHEAPSRSAMKIEEVFFRTGEHPKKGQRVVDLGAAPGGWTWAFARRGCKVLAVDRGPLRLPGGDAYTTRVRHVEENGITFQPPPSWLPVDWWVSDMLVPPGVAFGLIRRWLEGGRVRRFVCNIKIPQVQAWRAIKPIILWLESRRKVDWQVSQLYHDRREVTLYGKCLS